MASLRTPSMPISTFAQKCHQMVSAGHSTIGWTQEGDTVWVSNPERLAREHIPAYYDHSSYASWTRALHAHSFRKLGPSRWSHPEFHRDRPEIAASIVRKRPPHRGGTPATLTIVEGVNGAKAKLKEEMEQLQLPPLRATTSAEGEDESEDTEDCTAEERPPSLPSAPEEPSPEIVERLRKLRQQILAEKAIVRQMRGLLEQLEANATRARREELQLRHSVVQLADWIATTAMVPAVAAVAAGSIAASAAAMSAAVSTNALVAPSAALASRCVDEAHLESQLPLLHDSSCALLDSLSMNLNQLVVAAA
uniref:HSF-type DNA-binding domain-containing protein n=1 Tax=Coccolithus braarudii TaxID=221442 RepID=A0A7S0Q1P5_9EUKA